MLLQGVFSAALRVVRHVTAEPNLMFLDKKKVLVSSIALVTQLGVPGIRLLKLPHVWVQMIEL